jgi:hypothetical protein
LGLLKEFAQEDKPANALSDNINSILALLKSNKDSN